MYNYNQNATTLAELRNSPNQSTQNMDNSTDTRKTESCTLTTTNTKKRRTDKPCTTNPATETLIRQTGQNSQRTSVAITPLSPQAGNVPVLTDELPAVGLVEEVLDTSSSSASYHEGSNQNTSNVVPVMSTTASSLNRFEAREPHQYLAIQWNMNGLYNNLAELEILVREHSPMTIAIQESHLRSIGDSDRPLGGRYKWYHKIGNTRFQSIALAIRTDLPHEQIALETELLAVAVKVKGPRKYTALSLYIPCSGTQNLEEKFIDLVNQLDPPYIVMGDFNAHHQLWGSSRNDARGIAVVNAIEELDGVILNDGSPTWERPSAHPSAIDLSICSANFASQLQWTRHSDLCGSDHYPIGITLLVSPPETTRRRRWLYDQADWGAYEENVLIGIRANPNIQIEELSELIVEAAKQNIPRTSGIVRKKIRSLVVTRSKNGNQE